MAFPDITPFVGMTTYITIVVEFALGLGFGYFLGKLIKGLLGLILIGLVGVALNYAQFATLSNTVLHDLAPNLDQSTFLNIVSTIGLLFGVTVVLPMIVGLIVGFLIGR
jgi:hypothetical protein